MMYMVLTALLALNVASDLLLSIQNIANSLKHSAASLAKKNDHLNEAIQEAVQKEQATGNNKNVYIVELGNTIKKKTDEAVNLLEGHVQKMFSKEVGDTDPKSDKASPILAKLDESEANYRYWMIMLKGKKGADTDNGKRGAGEARLLKQSMDAFVDWANKEYYELLEEKDPEKNDPKAKEHFKKFCLDPKDDENIPKASEHKKETWEYFTFHRSPVVANVAILQKMKNDVYVIEAELLEKAKAKLKNVTFKIEKLIAIDAPESKYVVAGMDFQTKMYVSLTSSQETKLRFSGPNVKPAPDGSYATGKIKANSANIPDGKLEGKQKYNYTIYVPKATGGEEVLQVKGEFTVVKPTIQIRSASVTIMYRDCANDMEVDCPPLQSANAYDPIFEAKSAKVKQSPVKKNKVRVVPQGNECILQVYQKDGANKFEIGKEKFKVIAPPKPELVILVNNKVWDGKSGISKTDKVKVQVMPDKDFAQSLKEDARYQMSGLELLKKTGLGAPVPFKTLSATEVKEKPFYEFDILRYWADASKGDKVYFVVKGIDRINFENTKVPQEFREADLTSSTVIE